MADDTTKFTKLTDFANNHPITTKAAGFIGNAALGAAQTAVENKLGINDDFTDRYYNSSGHPILGEFAADAGIGMIPKGNAGLLASSLLGGGLKYINKKAGGIDLYGDGDLGQYGDLMEKPGRGIKFALDNTFGRLFNHGKLVGRGYTSNDDADVKFGDSARLDEINENGGLIDTYTILTDKYPELKSYIKPIDSKKYLGLTMDQLRNFDIPAGNKLNPVGSIRFNTLTGNGHYNSRDMYHFMTKMGLDPSILGINSLLDKGVVGVDLTPEFYKEFVLSDYFKGDKNAELKRLGFDPQQVFAEQHAKEVKQQQQQDIDNITKSVKATEEGIKQGKWVSDKSDVQKDQSANGDDSPTIPDHPRNTVDETKQPNVHKNNATDQYLQYLMYRDYQKDKQRAESQKDMGLIPLLLAAYGMAKIGR